MRVARKRCPREEAELVINVAPVSAAEARLLVVNSNRIRSCSGVASELPCETEVWDLSNLRIAGQPVRRETVVAWLNSIYRTISDNIYEHQEDVCRTATGLYELLSFSDAVETEPGILLSCLSHLEHPGLVIRAYLGDELVQINTDGSTYAFQGMQLACTTATSVCEVGAPAASVWEQQQLSTQVAEQLEALLYLAHSLELQPLVKRLHCFIASNTDNAAGQAILYGLLGLVFTGRVLEAALGPAASEDTQKAWISSVLTQRCGLVRGTYWTQQLLQPLNLSARLQDPLRFEATLQQDWQGSSKGEKVAVELDLFDSSTIRVGNTAWSVQLLLGPAVSDDTAHRKLMCSKLSST